MAYPLEKHGKYVIVGSSGTVHVRASTKAAAQSWIREHLRRYGSGSGDGPYKIKVDRSANPTRRKRGNPSVNYNTRQRALDVQKELKQEGFVTKLSKDAGGRYKVSYRRPKKNPSVSKDKWIKAKAVKFNRNGSVSIKK